MALLEFHYSTGGNLPTIPEPWAFRSPKEMFLEGASRVGITSQHPEILQGVKQLLGHLV